MAKSLKKRVSEARELMLSCTPSAYAVDRLIKLVRQQERNRADARIDREVKRIEDQLRRIHINGEPAHWMADRIKTEAVERARLRQRRRANGEVA